MFGCSLPDLHLSEGLACSIGDIEAGHFGEDALVD